MSSSMKEMLQHMKKATTGDLPPSRWDKAMRYLNDNNAHAMKLSQLKKTSIAEKKEKEEEEGVEEEGGDPGYFVFHDWLHDR